MEQSRAALPHPIDRSFHELVSRTLEKMRSPVLCYSQRLKLLNHAARLGIGRFEANLIIASAHHRLRSHCPAPPPSPHRNFTPLFIFLTLQSLILWGLWYTIRA